MTKAGFIAQISNKPASKVVKRATTDNLTYYTHQPIQSTTENEFSSGNLSHMPICKGFNLQFKIFTLTD